MPSSLASVRFNVTFDSETAAAYDRLRSEFAARNPDVEPAPGTLFRFLLRRHGSGTAGAVHVEPAPPPPPPSPASAPTAPSPIAASTDAPSPRAGEPAVEPPVQPSPRSTRVDRGAKAKKTKAAAKTARPSTRGKAPASPAPDQRQMEIPGADGTASTGSKEPAPVGKGRRSWASREDVEKIATYLSTPGAIGALALSRRANVPGAKSSLFAIQKAKREGGPLPGLSKSNAASILACINELPRAQSAATVARGSQGEETPRQG